MKQFKVLKEMTIQGVTVKPGDIIKIHEGINEQALLEGGKMAKDDVTAIYSNKANITAVIKTLVADKACMEEFLKLYNDKKKFYVTLSGKSCSIVTKQPTDKDYLYVEREEAEMIKKDDVKLFLLDFMNRID